MGTKKSIWTTAIQITMKLYFISSFLAFFISDCSRKTSSMAHYMGKGLGNGESEICSDITTQCLKSLGMVISRAPGGCRLPPVYLRFEPLDFLMADVIHLITIGSNWRVFAYWALNSRQNIASKGYLVEN